MQSLSVYIDESRNSSAHADRPAFGVIAGLVIPQDALDKLDHDIRERLNTTQNSDKHEAKWYNYGKVDDPYAQDPGFERACIILDRVFAHAASDRRIRIYASALDGPAYDNMASGMVENNDGGCIYKKLMDLHYRFFMYSVGRLVRADAPLLSQLQFNFDELHIGKQATDRLYDACNKISQSIAARGREFDPVYKAPPVHIDFKDSARVDLVQFSDLLAGAMCVGLDDNVRLTDTRLMLLKQMAGGIADMHGQKKPVIHAARDWQAFITDYINRPDTRFVIQRPHLRMDDTANNNAKRYWRYVCRHAASAAVC